MRDDWRRLPPGGRRVIRSTRLGDIAAPADEVIHFPLGILGFPGAREFVLVDQWPGSVFRWLQAVELPDLAFVVIAVLAYVPDYPVEDVRQALAFCQLDPDEELAVLAICRIPARPREPTANFMAPVGIGLRSRRGAQVLLHDSGFGVQTRFLSGG